jgi:hypothetical protein
VRVDPCPRKCTAPSCKTLNASATVRSYPHELRRVLTAFPTRRQEDARGETVQLEIAFVLIRSPAHSPPSSILGEDDDDS